MKTLLILSPKGGSGKSTTTRNLLACAARDGLRVAGLDTDPQGTLTDWLKVRQRLTDVNPIVGQWLALDDVVPVLRGTQADLVVIDTAPALESKASAVKALIEFSDLVLVPAQPTQDDVKSVKVVMKSIHALDKGGAFLMNRVKPRVKEYEAARMNLAKIASVVCAGIPDSVDIQRAMANGYGVVETDGRGKDEYESAWIEIKRWLGLAEFAVAPASAA